ncbi:MAG: hypothetical protein OXI77_04780 [Chloroflexota bacterium]|nr:hypothetical protein [Chloroflexota bacterium]MDE2907740.1 hypothetical protein [Chloroflexota bacterium]
MNESIRITKLIADVDGTLDRQAYGFFDLAEIAKGENVRRLLVANLVKHVDNVSAVWERSVYKPIMTDREIFPPRYLGDSIRFFWSRPFDEPVSRASVEEESRVALQAAVDAVVRAGFKNMDYVS